VLDAVRATQLHAYGYPRPTSPHLDTLARRGARFAAAMATASWSLPSHATMFTGRYGHELSTSWIDGLDSRYPTLAELFAARGFATGGFSANIEYTSRHFGLNRGFIHFEDGQVGVRAAISTTTIGAKLRGRLPVRLRYWLTPRKTADSVTAEFLSWQQELRGRPFFAFLNYFDGHAPYDPPAPWNRMFLAREPRSRDAWSSRPVPADVVEGLTGAYDGGIAYEDHAIGALLAGLALRGVLDSTIVVVTADHGEEFGEHGLIGHGHGLNNGALQVPLIVFAPGHHVPAGVVIDRPVSLRDLGATILALVDDTAAASFPGHSLAGLWQGDTTVEASPVLSEVDWAPHVPSDVPLGRGDMASLVQGRWHLIRLGDGSLSLYDRLLDPLEQTDRATDPALRSTLDALQSALQQAQRMGTPVPRRHR
jgi:arylsulfatase A-like enzyme